MSVSAGWIKLSETKKNDYYFRKIDLYSNIRWTNEHRQRVTMNLSDYLTASAPYGGPIAMIKHLDEFSILDTVTAASTTTFSRGVNNNDIDGNHSASSSGVGRVQTILIYSAAGTLLNSIELPKKESEVVNLGWTADLKLMCLTSHGKLFLFTIHGEVCSNHWNGHSSMNDIGAANHVLDGDLNIIDNAAQRTEDQFISLGFNKGEAVQTSCMWEQGCAVYTTDRRLLVADDFSINQPFKQFSLNMVMDEDIQPYVGSHCVDIKDNNTYSYRDMRCMIAVPSHISQSHTTEIILSPEDCATLIVASNNEVIDRKLFKHLRNAVSKGDSTQEASIQSLKLSPDGATVAAVYTDSEGNAECLVFNNTIDSLYLRFDTKSRACPTQISFCGNECLCVYWSPETIKDSDQYSTSAYMVDDRSDDTCLLLLVDCFGTYANFTFDGPLLLVQECDGSRLYTNHGAQLIERVHDSTISVFKIGSLEPCALLFDAYTEFCSKQSKSIKTIRDIRNQSMYNNGRIANVDDRIVDDNELSSLLYAIHNDSDALKSAVEKCIEAACREYDPVLQQKLLKAAVYGRTFLDQTLNSIVGMTSEERKIVIEQEYKRLYLQQQEHLLQTSNKEELVYRMISGNKIATNAFTNRCKEIRVLNEIRRTADIPLTYQQYEELTASALIGRLAELNHHFLAHKICDLLKLKPYSVLEHWACVKVRSQEDDKTIYRCINRQFKKHKPHVSYAKVALKAFQLGRNDLAQRLLASDEQPIDQIPLYLSMHETNKAIERAMQSNDADLLVLVVLYMIKYFDKKYMYEFLAEPEKETARKVFMNYCKHNENFKKLESFHNFVDDRNGSGMVYVLRAYSCYTEGEENFETNFLQYLEKAENYYSHTKNDTVNAEVTKMHKSLLSLQEELEKQVEEDGSFVGKTLHDTLYSVMINNKLTDKRKKHILKGMRAQFSVNEKRFWYAKVQALAHMDEWEKLEKFCFKSNTFKKSSPIGYEPFVDACLKKNQEKEALKYIPHVKDLQVKIDFYITLVKFKEAIEAARDAHDIEMLEYIKRKTNNTKTMDSIDKLIAQMQ